MSMKEHDHTFIKVSLKGDPRIHYLKLPINMGGHESCDTLLHSRQSFAPEFTLHMHEGKLLARSQKTGHPAELYLLACMGILIDEPFFSNSFPQKMFLKASQKCVCSCLAPAFLALLGIILRLKTTCDRRPDLSQVPIALRKVACTEDLRIHPDVFWQSVCGSFSVVGKTPNVPYLFSFLQVLGSQS